LGPPAANVPAQATKRAHGGKLYGGNAITIVVTARKDATISTGGFFIPELLLSA
jgi:hypothetical protein